MAALPQRLRGGAAFVVPGPVFDTPGMTERPPEEPDEPFEAPEGVESTEPPGDQAPAPEADLDGEPIPEDLSAHEDDVVLPGIVSNIGPQDGEGA